MTYRTSLDGLAKVVSTVVALIFIGIVVIQYSIIKGEGWAVSICTTVAFFLIYLLAFSLRPISYKITADELIIHRLFSDKRIERQQIMSVELIDKNNIGWAIRIFGSGGLFGYYGTFSSTKLGSMTWYATRRDRTILVKTNGLKKIILTPDDPELFVADFYAEH